jgi:hypothetical protein
VAAGSEAWVSWPLACWDCGFESRRGHGCLSFSRVVCCQVEVSATGRSLVQRSPTECGVSESDHESWIIRRPWATRGRCAMVKKKRAVAYINRRLAKCYGRYTVDMILMLIQFRVWREEGGGSVSVSWMIDHNVDLFFVSQAFDISNGVTFEFCVSCFRQLLYRLSGWHDADCCWHATLSAAIPTDRIEPLLSCDTHCFKTDGRTDVPPIRTAVARFFHIVTSYLLFPATFLSYRNMLFISTAVYVCCLWRSTDMAETAVLLTWIRKVASSNVDGATG